MSRRIFLLGVALFATQIAAGCCTQRAYLFPRLHCATNACAAPLVPYSPIIRGPLLPRPLLYGGVPVAGTPAYGGYADPGCSSCSASPNSVSSVPRAAMGGAPIYTMGGPSYGGGVPHDSVMLPQPTVVPPGAPKVEQTSDPKPMPK